MVSVHAPMNDPNKELIDAKNKSFLGSVTFFIYRVAATNVPPIAESLLIPNKVAGISLGYTEKRAGI